MVIHGIAYLKILRLVTLTQGHVYSDRQKMMNSNCLHTFVKNSYTHQKTVAAKTKLKDDGYPPINSIAHALQGELVDLVSLWMQNAE